MRSVLVQRRLRIQRETLRTLADRQLARVAGGTGDGSGTGEGGGGIIPDDDETLVCADDGSIIMSKGSRYC